MHTVDSYVLGFIVQIYISYDSGKSLYFLKQFDTYVGLLLKYTSQGSRIHIR